MRNLLVMDVANVIMREIATGKIMATATTSTNSISASLDEEKLQAGWGGGTVATINSNKAVELSFNDVFFSMDYLAIQQGTSLEEGATGMVLQTFTGVVVDNAGTLSVNVPVDVTATSAIMEDVDGTQDPVTITTGKITLPIGSEAVAGDEVTFYYEKTIVGQKVSIDSKNFPKLVEVLFHTRAFDPETNEVVQDIYIQFDKCKPAGNSAMELGINTNASTDMSFTALNKSKNSTEMGRYWAIDRV